MSASSHFDTIIRISDLVRTIEAEGMQLTVGTDFSAYRAIRKDQFRHRPLYPMFDINCSFIDATNGFWIIGTNDKGEVVHTQAIRSIDLANMTLEDHLTVHRQKYVTPGLIPENNHAYFSVPSSVSSITGRVCYHGEFWLMGGESGYRRQGFTQLLSRLVFELAYKTWDPDFVFGLVPATIAQKGIGVRYGYFHSEPGLWKSAENQILTEEWVVWMSNQDIARLTMRKPDTLVPEVSDQTLTGSIVTKLAVNNPGSPTELTG